MADLNDLIIVGLVNGSSVFNKDGSIVYTNNTGHTLQIGVSDGTQFDGGNGYIYEAVDTTGDMVDEVIKDKKLGTIYVAIVDSSTGLQLQSKDALGATKGILNMIPSGHIDGSKGGTGDANSGFFPNIFGLKKPYGQLSNYLTWAAWFIAILIVIRLFQGGGKSVTIINKK